MVLRWQDEHNDCEDTPCGEGAHMCFDLFNTWRCECTEGFQVSDNTCVAAVSPNVLGQRFEALAHQAAGLAPSVGPQADLAAAAVTAAANAVGDNPFAQPAPAPVAAATPPP